MGLENPPTNQEQMSQIKISGETRRVVKKLESLPFLHMYSVGSRIDLLLVWSGEKPATEIHLGYEWEVKADPQHLSGEDLEKSREILKEAGLFFIEDSLKTESIQGVEDDKEEPTVKYISEKKQIFVAKDLKSAAALQEAGRTEDDEAHGRLFGFPPTAIKAYVEAYRNPQAIINMSELPQDIQGEEYMAFAQFKFSRLHWKEELEIPKRWAQKIKDLNPELYQEAIKSYKDATK